MKLATYLHNGQARLGVVHGDGAHLLDLALAAERTRNPEPAFASMLALIEAGESALDTARGLLEKHAADPAFSVARSAVKLLAPVPVPAQMRDFMVFPLHVMQAGAGMMRVGARLRGEPLPEWKPFPEVPPVYRERPHYYKTNRFSVIGTDETVRWPRYSQVMDFELELGIFLGRRGANIPESRAHEHIFGYTIFNDFSARDAQQLEMQGRLGPVKGKDFDTGNAVGPWIVTRDEISKPYELKMSARVNGETWASGSSSDMMFSFEQMIAYVSQDETLHPGEFFGSGTMGNGCGLEQDRYLAHGDVVELEIEGIGVLRNTVCRQDV